MIPAGHIVAYEQFKLPYQTILPEAEKKSPDLQYTEKPGIVITGQLFSVSFDSLGWLSSYKSNGREILKAPLMPSFWRAPIDNDYGNNMPSRLKVWKDVNKKFKLTSLKTRQIIRQHG